MFEEIARALWGVDSFSMLDVQDSDRGELYQFQALIQNLVSLDNGESQAPISFGSRLKAVHKQAVSRNGQAQRPLRLRQSHLSSSSSFKNLGSVLGQLTMDTDSDYEDEMDLSDFIDLDALGGESSPRKDAPHERLPPGTSWKDVHPVIVLLLASVAFSIVLTMISGKFQETAGPAIHG